MDDILSDNNNNILKSGVSPEDLEDFRQLVEAEMSRALSEGLSNMDALESLNTGATALATMRQRLFNDCTEVGPPSAVREGQDEEGNLVMICAHAPQHRYNYQTGELIP